MNWKEYQKHVVGELCWCCSSATKTHYKTKRICPKCKSKFNYVCRQKEWELLKAFCVESTSYAASRALQISPKTAHKYYMQFRQIIWQEAIDERRQHFGELELDESYFGGKRKGKRGRGAGNKVKVFGILERQGRVCSIIVPNVTKETLMSKIECHTIKGSVFHTDSFRSYNDLSRYGKHYTIDHNKEFATSKSHINGIEGFWAFAKERYLRSHGVKEENFYLYLQEYEYRYNHRHEHLISILFSKFILPKISDFCKLKK